MFRFRTFLWVASLLALCMTPLRADAADLSVFAAASMKNALDAVDRAFEKATGKTVAASYAASSTLARQIEQGAPADVFISADLDWMDELARAGAIKPETRFLLLGNRLVLVANAKNPLTLDIRPDFALADALGRGRLALPEAASVPAGKYGKAALQALNVWPSVEDRLAPAENVRAALGYVARGEAPLGIVYATDAVAEPSVRVVATFPETSHPPIVYPVAITASSTTALAADYLAFLRTRAVRPLFEGQGFRVLD